MQTSAGQCTRTWTCLHVLMLFGYKTEQELYSFLLMNCCFLGQFKEILIRWFRKNLNMKKPASIQTLLVRISHWFSLRGVMSTKFAHIHSSTQYIAAHSQWEPAPWRKERRTTITWEIIISVTVTGCDFFVYFLTGYRVCWTLLCLYCPSCATHLPQPSHPSPGSWLAKLRELVG